MSSDQAVALAYDFVATQNHPQPRSHQLTAMNTTPFPVTGRRQAPHSNFRRRPGWSSDGRVIVLREIA